MKPARPHTWMIPAILLTILLCLAGRATALDLVEVAKLTSSGGGGTTEEVGRVVALSGDVALAGSGDGIGPRAVPVFRFDGLSWVEEQALVASDGEPFDDFGSAVAVEGDVALIGAEGEDAARGAVYVFRFDGATWIEEQKLTISGAESGDRFGCAVDLLGNAALIGACGEDSGAGAAHVFRFNGTSWIEEQKLSASDGSTDDLFGSAVSLTAGAALIGAFGDDAAQGSAYVFRHDGLGWVEEQKLTDPFGFSEDAFGLSVAIEGDHALIGAVGFEEFAGTALAFHFDGSTWTKTQQLYFRGVGGTNAFGLSLDIGGDTAMISAPGFDNGRGAARRYDRTGNTWVEGELLTSSDLVAEDSFAFDVAIDGGRALFGAPGESSFAGAAYVFEEQPDCVTGTVNAGAGSVTDVLYLNGSTGGSDRSVDAPEGDLIAVTLLKPTAGGNGKFVLHADAGAPTAASERVLPFGIGTTCFPFLTSDAASPSIVANNIGKEGAVGSSNYFGAPTEDPARATMSLHYGPGLPVGTVLTFQAVIVDPASLSTRGASTSNAVVLRVR